MDESIIEINKIYPNPTSEQINIVLGASLNNVGGVIHIYDLLGNQVLSKNIADLSSKEIQLDVSLLSMGMYLLSVTAHDGESKPLAFTIYN